MNSNFGGSSGQTNLTLQPWFHIFTDSFGRWGQLGGVNYVYESHDDGVLLPSSNGALGVRGDIRIGGYNVDGTSGTLAFTYLPPDGSDMVIDTSEGTFFKDNSANQNFINYRNTIMHEIGHSFGLEHVNSTSNLLMEPIIDTTFDGPQLDEVRGDQFFFGDVNDKSNSGQGNGTAALATSLGTIAGGSTKSIGTSANVAGQAINANAIDFVSISNLNDTDFFSFTVSQPSLLGATLTPRGGVFTQASEGATPTTFDANARNNLALTIFGTNGTSVLATANSQPAGAVESVANLVLPAAGPYYARITGADDTIQLYELSLTPTPILVGDYNRNGVVDTADYVLWRKTQGQSVAQGSGADGDFNSQVAPNDYTVWRSHFGQMAGSGTAAGSALQTVVPEPETCQLLLVLGVVLASLAARFDRATCRSLS
jgi:serralysin